MIQTTTRNAELSDLAELLKSQQARKVDVVAPASTIRAKGGQIHVKGADVQITEDGVTVTDGVYTPTAVFDGHVADKLGIPVKYLRRLRADAVDLYDANVNGWLHGRTVRRADGSSDVVRAAEARSFLLRAFRDDDGGPGIARAMLSDSYGIVDNLDVLTATLDGIRASGAEVEILSCDLTDTRMYVKIAAPSVVALAPELLKGYRAPSDVSGWTLDSARAAARREGQDYPEGQEPVVFGGFIVSNSEVGGGAFSITPRLLVRACKNGLVLPADGMRAIHLGAKLESGIVKWSEDTQRANLDVVTKKARDAVATFLDVEYVRDAVARLEAKSGTEVVNAADTVQRVGEKLRYTEAQIDGVLDHFIKGGQLTAGGVMQAVTSFAQTVDDADTAYDLEASGIAALECAAVLA